MISMKEKIEHHYHGSPDEGKDSRIQHLYEAQGFVLTHSDYSEDHNVRTLYFKKV